MVHLLRCLLMGLVFVGAVIARPSASWAVGLWDFGAVEVGTYDTDYLQFIHYKPLQGEIRIDSGTFFGSGEDAFDFDMKLTTCPVGVFVRELNCFVYFRFTPPGFADYEATLQILYTNRYVVDGETKYSGSFSQVPVEGWGFHRLEDSEHCTRCPGGSSVGIDNLSVSENIPIVGVPFALSYSSDTSSVAGLRDLGLDGWAPNIFKFFDDVSMTTIGTDGSVSRAPPLVFDDYGLTLSTDGTEAYKFSLEGGPVQSVIDTVTGVTKYSFDHSDGMRITDPFANTTTIHQVDDHTEITSPYGEVTRLGFGVNNILTTVTNPKGEAYVLGYSGKDKLTRVQKPGGQVSQMTYNSLGRLTKDTAPGGFSYTVASTVTKSGTDQIHNTTLTTATGLVTRKTHTSKPTGSTSTLTGVNGMVTTNTFVRGVSDTSVDPYGQRTQLTYAQDPRFGAAAPYVSRSEFTVPSTPIDVITDITKTATLADPEDPLTHQTLTTTTKLQNDTNRVYTSTYTASTKTWVHTSPLNRISKLSYNTGGLVKSTQTGTKSPRTFAYDARGRLTSVTQTAQRVSQLTYNSRGRLATFRNPLLQTESYLYDTAGRMTQKTGADGRNTLYAFDSNGRMTSLTTPSSRVHRFSYNDFDLVSQYTPPLIGGVSVGSISYQYNLDRKPPRFNTAMGNRFNTSTTRRLVS